VNLHRGLRSLAPNDAGNEGSMSAVRVDGRGVDLLGVTVYAIGEPGGFGVLGCLLPPTGVDDLDADARAAVGVAGFPGPGVVAAGGGDT